MKSPLLLLTLVLTASLLPAPQATAAQTITLDGTQGGRTFDGVGAISGGGGNSRLLYDYPEPERGQVLDYLFKPDYGASLQILKVEIGGDTNSTDGAESSHMHSAGDLNCDRGYEWWLMEQAKARNPNLRLYGLAWGAPGWLGGGSFWSQDTIDYLMAWLGCAAQHNLSIDYIGGWNEKQFNVPWFENLHATLAGRGFHTQVVASDQVGWKVADTMAADPAFKNAIDVIGVHYPCGYRKPQTTCTSNANALASGKPLMAAESGADDFNAGAASAARGIIRGYLDSRMTSYINWPLVAAIYPNLPFNSTGLVVADQPWSGHYEVGRLAWIFAQWGQFSQPGWRFIDSASGFLGGNPANGSYATLRSPGNDYSTILETADATAGQTVRFKVRGGLSAGQVHVWSTSLTSTNPADYLLHLADITPRRGSFSLTLQPGRIYSVTTTTGQAKGSAGAPPAVASLALPYSDSFDGDAVGHEPRYLSQQQGAFEVAPCAGGRAGLCVQQMAPLAPIPWDRPANPYTLLGDLGWSDYSVSVDVLLQEPGSVNLMGRVGVQRGKNVSGINAYYLQVSDTGAWSIVKNTRTGQLTTLAQGTVAALGTGRWHRLQLNFARMQITAQIDGTMVGSASDGSYVSGQIGLGVGGYQTPQFDNLSVS